MWRTWKSSLQVKMARFVWTEGETQCIFYKASKRKNVSTILLNKQTCTNKCNCTFCENLAGLNSKRIAAYALYTFQWKHLQIIIIFGQNYRNIAFILEKKSWKQIYCCILWQQKQTVYEIDHLPSQKCHSVMVTTRLLLRLTEVLDFVSEAALTIRQQQMVPRWPPAVPPLLPPFLAGWCHGKREYSLCVVLDRGGACQCQVKAGNPLELLLAAVMWPHPPTPGQRKCKWSELQWSPSAAAAELPARRQEDPPHYLLSTHPLQSFCP